MKPVKIAGEAELELLDAVEFYERRRTGLGLEFERAAREAVCIVREDPGRHPLRGDGTRRFLMERFPFAIQYMELADSI